MFEDAGGTPAIPARLMPIFFSASPRLRVSMPFLFFPFLLRVSAAPREHAFSFLPFSSPRANSSRLMPLWPPFT